jgi:hypothetical protein
MLSLVDLFLKKIVLSLIDLFLQKALLPVVHMFLQKTIYTKGTVITGGLVSPEINVLADFFLHKTISSLLHLFLQKTILPWNICSFRIQCLLLVDLFLQKAMFVRFIHLCNQYEDVHSSVRHFTSCCCNGLDYFPKP